jgi:CubicO group peptidase (beta-lactamase class C family)
MAIVSPADSPALIPLATQPEGVPFPTAHWPQAPIGPAVDAARLQQMIEHAVVDQPPELGTTLALVVVHRGAIVTEAYGPDTDVDTALISWSMAKSVVHALIGLLVTDGRLDVTERAAVTEWADPADSRHDITVDQLLRMASGLEFVEDYVDDSVSHCLDMLFGAGTADTAAYAAALPRIAPADTVFNYSSGTTNILSRLVGGLTGETVAARRAWMNQQLFEPLGMQSVEPRFDDMGTFVGSSFLYATARDFARFGLLYARDGMWDGMRLLPEGWVDDARRLRGIDDEGHGYGAHWWIRDDGRGSFQCQGYETQRVRVVPASDLVVVRLGKTPAEHGPTVDGWLDEVVALF